MPERMLILVIVVMAFEAKRIPEIMDGPGYSEKLRRPMSFAAKKPTNEGFKGKDRT